MTIEKKLGIFGKDIILKKDKIYAQDYFCTLCLKDKKYVQAELFYSPEENTQEIPYCKKCAEYLKVKSMIF